MLKKETGVQISPPNLKLIGVKIKGTAPYVQNQFSQKAKDEMVNGQTDGVKKKGGAKRKPRDFDEQFINAQHISTEGWNGVPAGCFRAAMISACRLINFKMTLAKLSVFIIADGFDREDGTPLVKIEGKPEKCVHHVRFSSGAPDVKGRAMWRDWSIDLKIQFDEDQFSEKDIANLLMRVGMQVGIGEGRPDSKKSCGMGWGLFTVK